MPSKLHVRALTWVPTHRAQKPKRTFYPSSINPSMLKQEYHCSPRHDPSPETGIGGGGGGGGLYVCGLQSIAEISGRELPKE